MAPSVGELDEAQGEPFRVEHERDRIRLSGDLRLAHAAGVWRQLVAATRDVTGPIAFDLSQVDAIDGATMAMLFDLRGELAGEGVEAELTGAPPRFAPLLRLYGGDSEVRDEPPPAKRRLLEQVGRRLTAVWDEAARAVDFVGNTILAAVAIVRHPHLGYWSFVPALAQRAGAEGLPIVLVINGLIGFAMAFQSAKQLQLYGATIYVADLVGISMTRELSPLITALVIAGRSGAGYAAEIGSMQIDEEIDALRTLGLRPFNWIVIPRALALVLVVPALTLLGDFFGIAGGLVVGIVDLDLTAYGYLRQTKLAVVPWDVATGLIKSVAFSIAIVFVACQQGFATSGGGAEGVGRRTTSTVVMSIFVLVTLNAILTVIFRVFAV